MGVGVGGTVKIISSGPYCFTAYYLLTGSLRDKESFEILNLKVEC